MPLPEAWSPQLPPLRDFVVSPGFSGALIFLAAIILFVAVLFASRRAGARLDKQLEQQDLHHQQVRTDRQRRQAVDRCWERVVWLVTTAGTEPAARDADDAGLGLGPELALELLEGLHRDAKELGDDTLVGAVAVYLAQYGLVLGQQGGPVPESLPESNGRPEQSPDIVPSAAPPLKTAEHAPATAERPAAKGQSK
jgi:hypothetical protein